MVVEGFGTANPPVYDKRGKRLLSFFVVCQVDKILGQYIYPQLVGFTSFENKALNFSIYETIGTFGVLWC